jgi:glycosyltransferase involved in cell wall biosynthesis
MDQAQAGSQARTKTQFMLTQPLALRGTSRADGRPLWRRLASFARRKLRALADRVPGRLVRAKKARPGERLRVVIELGSFDKGGLEKVVLDSAIAFDRARIEPLVVTPGTVGHLGKIAGEAGIAVEQVPAEGMERAYGAILDRFAPHLSMSHFSTAGYAQFRRRGIPNITFIHNVYAFMSEGQRARFLADDPSVDLYVAVSRKAARYASANLGIDAARITVVPNGLILSEHEARERRKPTLTRADFGLSEQDYVFLNPASYNLHKGHYVMAAALQSVLKVRRDLKILCVGNEIYPPHVAQLRAHVAALGLNDHMLMPGYYPDIEQVMRLADAVMLPSFIEGWSIAMNESMFYRKPLILTDTGGASEVIENDDIGILLPTEYPALETLDGAALDTLAYTPREYRTAEPLAQAMIRFADEREHWARAGEIGRRKIYEHYDFRSIVPQYEELMWQVAAKAPVR